MPQIFTKLKVTLKFTSILITEQGILCVQNSIRNLHYTKYNLLHGLLFLIFFIYKFA